MAVANVAKPYSDARTPPMSGPIAQPTPYAAFHSPESLVVKNNASKKTQKYRGTSGAMDTNAPYAGHRDKHRQVRYGVREP